MKKLFIFLLLGIFMFSFTSALTNITNCGQLQNISNNVTESYQLINNIDCTGVAWIPIGSSTSRFSGNLSGNGFDIKNIYYVNDSNSSLNSGRGMFYAISGNSVVSNLSLTNFTIMGRTSIGTLAGFLYDNCLIDNIKSSGNVNSSYFGTGVGGLIGTMGGINGNYPIIKNSYTNVNVYSNSQRTGGFIGMLSRGSINNSYSTGYVTSTELYIGGFVGTNSFATITSSYYDTNTSGQSDTGNGEPKTTTEMKNQTTFTGWDFTNVWGINPTGTDYPKLRVFGGDFNAPSIVLNYPTALIDYGKINGTLQLNFTATDSNLDKVWYNYNGTNVTIAGAVSGVYNISNITLTTNKSVNLCANDTAGNEYCEVIGWDYKVFENGRSYNSTSYETATEGYQINITANTSLTAVALEFNGTDYPMTGSYTYSRDLPTSSVGNNSIRYKFTYGAETIYSDYSYQNVLSTVLALCNATYSVPYLNITFKDESTLGSINATMPLGEFDYYLGTGTVTKQLQFINTSENERYSFCASPSNRTLNIDPYVQYASSGYPQRIWNPTVSSYSNTTTSQVLYLLSSSDGIYVTFQVINSADQLQEGVEVSATRQISGSDVVVASGTTDAAGSVTFWLNPDFSHDFSFSKTGFTTYETSFSATQTSYTITLGGDGGSSVPNDYTRGISLSYLPTQQELFNGTAYTFSFTVDSSFWDLDSFGYNLRLANGTIVASPTSTTSGVAASNSYNVNNQSIIYMDYYWIINGTTTSASKYWIVTNTGYSSWSIKHFFTRLNTYMTIGFFGIDNFGRYLIVFIVLFITIGIMSYKYGLTSPIAIMSMIFLVIYFFDNVVGLIPIIRGIPHLLTYLAGIILAVTILKEVTS